MRRKAAARAPGYFEKRKQAKAQAETAMTREQNQLIASYLPQLKDLLKESS